MKLLCKWHNRGLKVFMSVLTSGNLHLDLEEKDEVLKKLYRLFGARTPTVMCGGLAARLCDDIVMERFMHLAKSARSCVPCAMPRRTGTGSRL